VGNLPEDRLGVTLGYNIYIDSDAAGRGWQAMDLLSVVTHELGHVLGFDHDSAGAIPVMRDSLDAGTYSAVAAGDGTFVIELGAAASTAAGFFAVAATEQQAAGQDADGAPKVLPSPATKFEALAKLLDAGRAGKYNSSFDSLGRALLNKKDR
jgi:hypothetical protein